MSAEHIKKIVINWTHVIAVAEWDPDDDGSAQTRVFLTSGAALNLRMPVDEAEQAMKEALREALRRPNA